MADLRAVEALAPERTVTTYRGTIVKVGGVLAVNVNGKVIAARWADPLSVAEGDAVLVEISSARGGQGSALVRSRIAAAARPSTGTVATVPASSPTISVTGSDGIAYLATFHSSYTPVVGDTVTLSWAAAVPSVTGKVTTTAAPPPPPPPVAPPPAPAASGSKPFPASASDTYWPSGGWGSWASGGGHVYQGGSSYGGPVYGAWFYAGALAQLSGKTLTRLRFTLGARRPVGNNNQPVTVHLYAHTSANKPGGDVSRVAGPFDIVVQPGQGLAEYDLPLSFATALQGGGGIAIAGEPYFGCLGVYTQPESGLITAEWSG